MAAVAPQVAAVPRMQIDALDGIRGLAVLLVLASHLSVEAWFLIPGLNMAGTGKVGVYLFYFLSAFLLTLPFLNSEPERFRQRSFWRHYILRRVLRIWPLYLLVLLLSALTTAVDWLPSSGWPFRMSAEELMRHLLLQEGKDVLWSIPVEFKYYFVLPVVALVLVLLLRKSAWLAVPAVAAAIAATLWFRPPEASVPADLHVVYYLPIFLLGQLAALLHWHMHRWLKADAWFHRGMDVLACGCLALLIATIPSVYTKLTGAEFIWYQRFQKDFLFFGLAWGGFVLGTINGTGRLAWFFSLPWMRYIGLISFSLYLWHRGAMLIAFRLDLDGYVAAWGTFLLALLIAAISYHCIEKPLLKIRI